MTVNFTALWRAVLAAALWCSLSCAPAQTPIRITKVDPPNWFARMPKPMLLLRGDGFTGAKFSLSDKALHLERTQISDNGHWAILWLSASPAAEETITIRAASAGSHAEQSFTFAARRPASDGFAGFSSRDVMYLIMTDRFADGDQTNDGLLGASAASSADAIAERGKPRGWHGGDLPGISQHLDYIQQIGANTVWMTPVYENHRFESYHGYHATDMYKVDEHYGSLRDLQALGAELHHRGMKLVLDEVPNHVGPDHPWVKDSPLPDWFHGTAAKHIPGETKFEALIDPHAPARDKRSTLEGWFVNLLPDMNTENPAVAQYLRQNVIWWVEETGADGIRIDTLPYIDRPFWGPYLNGLTAIYPRMTEVGEVSNPDPVFVSAFAAGVTRAGEDTALWAPFDYPFNWAVRDALAKGQPLTKIAGLFAADELYPHPERLVTFIDNHDTSRFRDDAKSVAAEKMAIGLLMTARGMPQIYSGDELAMPGEDDPDNRRDFPGGFVNDKRSAFTPQGRTAEENEMFDWVVKLGAIRKSHAALQCGTQQTLEAAADSLVLARIAGNAGCGGNERMIAAVGRGKATELDVELAGTALEGCHAVQVDLARSDGQATVSGSKLHLRLASNDFLVAHCE